MWWDLSAREQKECFCEYATAEMQPVAHLLRAQYCHRNPNVTLICMLGSGISEIAAIVSRIVNMNTWFQTIGVAPIAIRAYVCGNDNFVKGKKPRPEYCDLGTWKCNAKRWRDEVIEANVYTLPSEVKHGVDFDLKSGSRATNFRYCAEQLCDALSRISIA